MIKKTTTQTPRQAAAKKAVATKKANNLKKAVAKTIGNSKVIGKHGPTKKSLPSPEHQIAVKIGEQDYTKKANQILNRCHANTIKEISKNSQIMGTLYTKMKDRGDMPRLYTEKQLGNAFVAILKLASDVQDKK